VTKSFTGTLASILVAEGKIDLRAPIPLSIHCCRPQVRP
jgi:hypothetical protein